MTPVGAVALGLVLALLDLRISGFDVLPDVLGWCVAVSGLSRLTRLDGRFGPALRCALLTAVLSLSDLVRGQVTTTTDTMTTTSDAAPAGLHGWLVTGYGVAGVVVVVLLSLALRDRARLAGDPPLAERFTLFAFLQAGLGVLALLGSVFALLTTDDGSIEPTGGLAALTLAVVVAALAVHVFFLLALRGARERPWLQDPAPSVQENLPG